MNTSLLFSTIEVTRQAFYGSSLSFAIVNLKPIVPGPRPLIQSALKVLTPHQLPQMTMLLWWRLPVLSCSERMNTAKL
ncbi:uncharacterized protein EV420DRAFT_1570390 [Desarmillaria tabescens]|uniref:Uncharacterized protein n=1 Tax=Armillaria tabescens TaxID=1929756 RepID=A0AA39MTC3_ARMTA|nr:uncharacterized protein EV420DRAFT_1570390 [Desarmillaria tabescens]KAK0446386.1 hypothetical protein EV420DRAFT_1570390 [Desarmillaria tabescens]